MKKYFANNISTLPLFNKDNKKYVAAASVSSLLDLVPELRQYNQDTLPTNIMKIARELASGTPINMMTDEVQDYGKEESSEEEMLACRVNWEKSAMALPYADTKFEEDGDGRVGLGIQVCGNRDGRLTEVSIEEVGRELHITNTWSEAAKSTECFKMAVDDHNPFSERMKQFDATMKNLCGSKREVQRKMVLDLPFQVDERFYVHNSANGIRAPGVNFVKFTNTFQCLLIVDLVKKKAPIYAGRTNENEMDIPVFTRASSRY